VGVGGVMDSRWVAGVIGIGFAPSHVPTCVPTHSLALLQSYHVSYALECGWWCLQVAQQARNSPTLVLEFWQHATSMHTFSFSALLKAMNMSY
jgi:hypothetical protein